MNNTTNWLLAIITLLLAGLLLRETVLSNPIKAQTMSQTSQEQSQIAVDNSTVYVLQNGKLSVYVWNNKLSEAFYGKPDPKQLHFLFSKEVEK